MITVKAPSKEDIEAVFLDEENYYRAADDNSPLLKDFDINMIHDNPDKIKVMGAYINNEIASLMVEHDNEIHFMLLRKYHEYAHKIADELLKHFPGEIFTKVPDCYPSTLHFTLKHNFVETGKTSGTFLKNGQFYDEHILSRLTCQ